VLKSCLMALRLHLVSVMVSPVTCTLRYRTSLTCRMQCTVCWWSLMHVQWLLKLWVAHYEAIDLQCVSEKSSPPPKTFWNIFTSVNSFCVKFCRFVDNSYPHMSINFCRFILIFHQMALMFPRVPIVFALSSFEHSPIKWKCRGRPPTAWFTQNGWASVVNWTADFLNTAPLPPFVRVTGNDSFCTKSLLTKRLHA